MGSEKHEDNSWAVKMADDWFKQLSWGQQEIAAATTALQNYADHLEQLFAE